MVPSQGNGTPDTTTDRVTLCREQPNQINQTMKTQVVKHDEDQLVLLKREVEEIKRNVSKVERDTASLTKEVNSVRDYVHQFAQTQERSFQHLERSLQQQLHELRSDKYKDHVNKAMFIAIVCILFYLFYML